MQVIRSVFGGAGKDGDFDWMVTQDHYEDALFVFNDNEAQWPRHLGYISRCCVLQLGRCQMQKLSDGRTAQLAKSIRFLSPIS